MHVFKVLLQVSPHCIDLARYLNKNITAINSAGIGIKIEKIQDDELTEDMVMTLRNNGIDSFPALLAQGSAPYIGIEAIVDFLEGQIASRETFRGASSGSGGGAMRGHVGEFGTNPDLADFWQKELFSGIVPDRRGGIREVDADEESPEEEISRRLREYEQNVPRHRRNKETRVYEAFMESAYKRRNNRMRAPGNNDRHAIPAEDFDDNIYADTQEGRRRNRGGRRRQRRDPYPEDEDDSIDDYDAADDYDYDGDNYGRRRGRRGGGRNADAVFTGDDADMDQKMLDAWMQKNPGGDIN